MKKVLLVPLYLITIICIIAVISICLNVYIDTQPDFVTKMESAINPTAFTHCLDHYAEVKQTSVECTTLYDNENGTYDIKGYITITDDYNDKYKIKFNATVGIDESGNMKCNFFNLLHNKK